MTDKGGRVNFFFLFALIRGRGRGGRNAGRLGGGREEGGSRGLYLPSTRVRGKGGNHDKERHRDCRI